MNVSPFACWTLDSMFAAPNNDKQRQPACRWNRSCPGVIQYWINYRWLLVDDINTSINFYSGKQKKKKDRKKPDAIEETARERQMKGENIHVIIHSYDVYVCVCVPDENQCNRYFCLNVLTTAYDFRRVSPYHTMSTYITSQIYCDVIRQFDDMLFIIGTYI